MDALITISFMQGKRTVGAIETAVKIPDSLVDKIDSEPGSVAEYAITKAREKNREGVELIKASHKA